MTDAMPRVRRVLLEPFEFFYTAVAHVAWRTRCWRLAVWALSKLHELGVADPDASLSLAIAYAKQDRWDATLAALEQIEGGLSSKKADAARWYNHALALYELGRTGECKQILEHSITPEWDTASIREAKLLLMRSKISLLGAFGAPDDGDWDKIVAVLDRGRSEGVEDNHTRFWLGMALMRRRRWEEALQEFEQVDAPLDEGSQRVKTLNHAWVLYKLDRVQESRELLEESSVSNWPEPERSEALQLVSQLRG